MGCSESAVDEPKMMDRPMTVAESKRSLVEFVRALSEPSIRRPSSELSPNARRKGNHAINSINELTPTQEEYLSRYKMRIYGCMSDPVLQASTFEMIESEFYDTYHKQINRRVLFDLYGVH